MPQKAKRNNIPGIKYIWIMCSSVAVMLISLVALVINLIAKPGTLGDAISSAIIIVVSIGAIITGIIIIAIGLFYYLKFGRYNKKPKIPASVFVVLAILMFIIALALLV